MPGASPSPARVTARAVCCRSGRGAARCDRASCCCSIPLIPTVWTAATSARCRPPPSSDARRRSICARRPQRLHPPKPRRSGMQTNIFESNANGYAGRVRLFGINEAIVLVALDPSDAENAPDYRVHLDDEDGPEVGGAWKRVGERAGDYIALEIDSPLFPAAFRPVLFRADDDGRTFRLSWKRPRPRDDRS